MLKSASSLLLLIAVVPFPVAGFCNWGPDGTAGTSVCDGGAQGGAWCNANEGQCETGCGGHWCGPVVPPPVPVTPPPTPPVNPPSAGFCNWGPDGTAATSVCAGGAAGGAWCNANEGQCETGCGGRWCTGDAPAPTPSGSGWNTATWTTYTSYAACCKDSPNYDPSAPREECDVYSACDYTGDFAYIGHKSYDYVRTNNIIAFFTNNGDNSAYGNKRLRIRALGKTVEVLVADTCGDHDCGGCCSANARPTGNLVDMEYWTVVNNFGDVSVAHGQVEWQLV